MMDKRWYRTFFAGITSEFWDELAVPQMTEEEGAFILPLLKLSSDGIVLDAPSGSGRMAIWLGKKGFAVEGWDIYQTAVDKLETQAKKVKLPVSGFQMDLAEGQLPQNKYAGAVCLGNCFGYFDPTGMANFIRSVSESLLPGARWIINSGMAAESIFPNWQDEDVFEAGNLRMNIENAYDGIDSYVETTMRFERLDSGEEEIRQMRHYVYTLKEMRLMFEKAGLGTLAIYGGTDGREFALGDEQLYWVVEKSGK